MTRLLVLALLVLCGCQDPDAHVALAGSVVLPVRIEAPKPLQVPAHEASVCVRVAHGDTLDDSLWAIRRQNGSLVRFVALAQNMGGVTDTLRLPSYLGRDWYCVSEISTRLHPPYRNIALVSTGGVTVDSVVWFSADK